MAVQNSPMRRVVVYCGELLPLSLLLSALSVEDILKIRADCLRNKALTRPVGRVCGVRSGFQSKQEVVPYSRGGRGLTGLLTVRKTTVKVAENDE